MKWPAEIRVQTLLLPMSIRLVCTVRPVIISTGDTAEDV